jgi:hypothetical protein
MSALALPDLAQAIEAEHHATVSAFRATLEHAIRTDAKADRPDYAVRTLALVY